MRSLPLLAGLAAAVTLLLGGCSADAQPDVVPRAQTADAPHASAALATAATRSAAGPATTRTVTAPFDGVERSYTVMTPPDADAGALPLIVVLHGAFVTGSAELARTGFGSLAEQGAAVVVAPESLGPAWNSGAGCCSTAAAQHVDDTGFVSAVIADVQRSAHTDPRRTSVVGYSSGGKLAYDLACTDHPALAAVATYGAGPQLPCRNTTPITFVVGYGDKDTNEPMAGAPHDAHGLHQPEAETVAQLRARDDASGPPTSAQVGPAAITTWHSRTTAATVTQIIWHGSTHQWPGSAPDVPAQASGLSLYWPILSAARSA